MGLHEIGGRPNFPQVGPCRNSSSISKIPPQHAEEHDFVTIFKIPKSYISIVLRIVVRILQKVIFFVFGLIVSSIALNLQQALMSLKVHEYLTPSGQRQVSHGFHKIMLLNIEFQ